MKCDIHGDVKLMGMRMVTLASEKIHSQQKHISMPVDRAWYGNGRVNIHTPHNRKYEVPTEQ